MHMHPVRLRLRLELLEILVEMRERVLLDRRRQSAEFLPFGDVARFVIALLPQVPEALVVHLLVLGRGEKSRGRLRLIDRSIAVYFRAARLLLALGPKRPGSAFRMVEATSRSDDRVAVVAGEDFGMEDCARVRAIGIGSHSLAPLRICAMWMNLIGTPMR